MKMDDKLPLAKKVRELIKEQGVYLVTGPSGCGKTTFVETLRPSIYMTQFHSLRPGGYVNTFYPLNTLKLPFPVKDKQRFGGEIMPGAIVKGLSGGQRKLCLCAHVNQVVLASSAPLLVVLDEPFAGVTTNYIPFQLDLIDDWSRKGHTIVVIDNDHHEHTTQQGWKRIELDLRKVVRYNGQTIEIPVPLLPVDRRPVASKYRQDLTLFLKNELFNVGTVTNTKALQAFIASLISLPFTAGPETDMGAILMAMNIVMLSMMTMGSFLPAREVQYNQIAGEASLGLITAPRFTAMLTILDDLLKMTCVMCAVFAIHSIWWDKDVVSNWPNGGFIWELMIGAIFFMWHQICITVAPLLAGIPLIFVMNIYMLDMIFTFFVAGVFNPQSGVLPGNRYGFLGQLPAAVYTFTGSAYSPFIPVHFSRTDATVSLVCWVLIDLILMAGPLWIPLIGKWIRMSASSRTFGSSTAFKK
jgi:hypothetical protein